MYKLYFERDGIVQPTWYQICFESVALSKANIPPSEWDTVVGLVRKLKKAGKADGSTVMDVPLYKLDTEGSQKVELETAEFNMLLKFIEGTQWKVAVLETVVDVRDWLEHLPPADAK